MLSLIFTIKNCNYYYLIEEKTGAYSILFDFIFKIKYCINFNLKEKKNR